MISQQPAKATDSWTNSQPGSHNSRTAVAVMVIDQASYLGLIYIHGNHTKYMRVGY